MALITQSPSLFGSPYNPLYLQDQSCLPTTASGDMKNAPAEQEPVKSSTNEEKKDYSVSFVGGVKLKFCEKETLVDYDSSRTLKVGGTITAVLRYPHLVGYLSGIKKKIMASENLAVLLLGPGLENLTCPGKISSPQTHEMLSAFPPCTKVTIVDREDFVTNLGNSTFEEPHMDWAKKILSYSEGYNVKNLSQYRVKKIKKYMSEIPTKIQQDLKLVKQDFQAFEPTEKYDYIFAIQSLYYALQKVDQCRETSLKMIDKYLGSLKSDGIFIADEILYQMMRKNITLMPSPEELENSPLKWTYQKTIFEARRILVPNTSRNIVKIPVVLYKGKQGNNLLTSTSDIYCIKRLSGKVKRASKKLTAISEGQSSKRQKNSLD